MNILHLIETLDIGGAQVRLLNDLKFMDRQRFNHVVCALSGNGKMRSELDALGVEVYSLNGIRSLATMRELARIIRQNRIDIIHTQLFFADLYGRIAGKLLRVPFIVTTVQSSVYEPDTVYLYSRKRKWLDKYTAGFCNTRFIAVSEFVKSSINKHLKIALDKIEVIPNYVDIEERNKIDLNYVNQLRKELSLKTEETVLITVGRLNPAKGIEYLIEAFAGVAARYKSVKLFIAGDGFYRERLEGLAKNCGAADKVIFLGERNDVKELLYLSDIFVFPTLSEGLPLSLLEAMAIGKPCIASNIPPVREVIENESIGILVEPKDALGIKNALQMLIEEPAKARQLGANGREFIKCKFDPVQNAKRLENLYIKLLA